MKTQFEIMAMNAPIPCDICGGFMHPLYGGGWDNDRMICGERDDCGAEIVFPTSTLPEEN